MCFNDQTEILICTDTKLVTYKSQRKQMMTYTMQEALDAENEMKGPHVKKKGDFS